MHSQVMMKRVIMRIIMEDINRIKQKEIGVLALLLVGQNSQKSKLSDVSFSHHMK